MKFIRHLSLALAVGALSLSPTVWAHDGRDMADMDGKTAKGQLVPITQKDAAWVAKAKAEYPTDACVVSGDKLGADMGKPADFIYREEGKPDRLVSFCCKDCVKDFGKNPAKYLKDLDEAAAKKNGEMPAEHHHH